MFDRNLWPGRALVFALFALTSADYAFSGEKSTPPVVAGFERFFVKENGDPARGGLLLLSELNCTSCHQGEAGPLAKKSAPNLDGIGARVKRGYLKTFLANPHAAKPGTAMPDVFAGDPDKADKIEAIAHYLASTGTPRQERPDRKQVGLGQTIYQQIGCVACHGTRKANGAAAQVPPECVPLPDLKAKYTLGTMREFLLNPLHSRPAGRMPSLLDGKEAAAVANFLLQGFTADSAPNMKYTYYEGDWQNLPDFDKLKPLANGIASDFDISVAKRSNNMALRFEGFLRIDRDGPYTFHITSDDGSKLWIDDKLVVANDGVHPPSTKSAGTKLTKGMHKLVAGVFNGGGGVELAIDFEGSGLSRQSVAPFVTMTAEPTPVVEKKDDSFELKPDLVGKGRELFASVGCVNCHQMNDKALPAPKNATALAQLGKNGCLSETPIKGLPWFGLSGVQRKAIVAALSSANKKLAPSEVVNHTLLTFNCYACHDRDKVGGPIEALNKSFATNFPEMGDEARLPPTLTGVGAKLVPAYLAKILDKGSDDRPYMLTRMPGFGAANVDHLVKIVGEIDKLTPVAEVKFDADLKKVKAEGKHMVGAQAFGCIRCHTFAGNKAEGVQGIDMTILTQRLKHDWFYQYLLEPNKFRPGTRMPTSWPEGETTLKKILGGKTNQQIEAIWVYLSDGTKAPLPYGVKKQLMPLIPEGDAIIYRNFIEGAGPRAIAVGFPEKAHLAFDANDVRIAMVWHGAFMDATRHWTDRGVGYEPPAGDDVIKLPTGAAFAELTKPDHPWPTKSARELGFGFRGYSVTKDQRPTFRYAFNGVEVEDTPNAIVSGETPKLRRTLVLSAKEAPANLYYRAMVADKIEPQSDGTYKINGEFRMKIDAGTMPQLRQSAGKIELLVPLRFQDGRAKLVQEYLW